jgi:tight adherence protein C
LLFVVLLGFVGFLVAMAASFVLRAMFDPVKARIDVAQGHESAASTSPLQMDWLKRIGSVILPKAEAKRRQTVDRLEQAGYRSPQALSIFFGVKLLAFVAVPVVVLALLIFVWGNSVVQSMQWIFLLGVFAFVAPDFWLKRAVSRRQNLLRHALPDALDLMVVCTEAGLGLNAAMKRVADDIGVQHPELADEFSLVIMQARAGVETRAALKEMEHRTGLEDIKSFVTTLLQAMRFGTSVAESLRVFSEDMRDKRLQRAQEKAAQLSLKMLMPIALFMMPMFLLIAIGPAGLALMRSVNTITGNG